MIGAVLNVDGVGIDRDWPRGVTRQGGDELGVRRPNGVCGCLRARICNEHANCKRARPKAHLAYATPLSARNSSSSSTYALERIAANWPAVRVFGRVVECQPIRRADAAPPLLTLSREVTR